MKTGTLAGLLAGAALLLGGAAMAGAKKTTGAAADRPPWFEYRIQPGDTLSALSLLFFGDAKQWPSLLTGQADQFNVADALPIERSGMFAHSSIASRGPFAARRGSVRSSWSQEHYPHMQYQHGKYC